MNKYIISKYEFNLFNEFKTIYLFIYLFHFFHKKYLINFDYFKAIQILHVFSLKNYSLVK